MSTLLVNQINPVSGNTLTLSGSNIIIPGNLTITGNLSGSLTGSVESSSYALTSSYALNSPGGGTTDTGSLLLTASVDSNVITFTKGDASTFNITVDTGSASSIETGSFATTGSNTFIGGQTINGDLNFSGSSIEYKLDVVGSTFHLNRSGSLGGGTNTYQTEIHHNGSKTQFKSDGSVRMELNGNVLEVQGDIDVTLGNQVTNVISASYFSGSFVGDGSGLTGISGGSIETGSFATTGSNTFIGNQTVTGSLNVSGSSTFKGNQTISGRLSQGEANTSFGNFSHAEGTNTLASGSYSHAEGQNTHAKGDSSHAEGNSTLAEGSYSHAEGFGTVSSGVMSHAEGIQTLASGDYSHAEGSQTLASGDYSHAEGRQTTASGDYSHAEGRETVALGDYQHVQGQFNISSSNQGAFIIGNGVDDSNRSNLVYASGSQFQVTGSLNVSGPSTFTGNQIVNTNLSLTSSATMSVFTTGGSSGMQITKDQLLINPNLNSDRVTLSGGHLSLSAVNSYSRMYLTNRNGSNDTGSIEIHRTQFYGKDTDTYNGLKAGLRVYQSVGTGSLGSFNFYTSASSAFGFSTGVLDMRISTGSKIELFRNTTITGSLNVKGDVNLSGSKQVGIEADASKTFIKSTGVFINEDETRAKATLSPGELDVTGRPGAAQVKLRNNNDIDDAIFDAGQISFYGPSDSNAYGGVQGKIQARVDSGSGVVASYLEFYTSGSVGFPFDSSEVDMRISTGSEIELFRDTTISGSLNVSGSSAFRGTQTLYSNLYLTSSATMSIVTTGGFPGMQITKDQLSINPNLNSDRALLYGGNLQLSAANGYNAIYLTNRNGSSDTSSMEIGKMQFQGNETDDNFGLKAGLRVFQSEGTGSTGHINFYTSASSALGFNTGDPDMRISTGSKIELFRDTTVTGSVSITSVLTLAPNDPLPTEQPTGSISVSGSGVDCKPYFYNGTDWTSMI